MKKSLFLACLISFSFSLTSQTYVPDNNFEQALIDLGYDTGPLDDYVPTANINTIPSLDVSGYFISSLEGIEDFTALQFLDCSSNNLIALDVYSNTALEELQCFDNFIGNSGNQLVLPNSNSLRILQCGDNNLSTLDVSAYTQLEELYCYNNGTDLGNLDFTSNTALIVLNVHDSGVTSLNITQCSSLETLDCYDFDSGGLLTNLNTSGNPLLSYLSCYGNNIGSLDFTNNTSLTYINCSDNPLGSIDVSMLSNLQTLWCWTTGLSSLNVSSNLLLQRIDFGDNSITTANLMLPNTNTLLELWGYYNLFTGTINTSAFTNLDIMDFTGNNITSIDVSNNTALTRLWMWDNDLSNIDVSNNTQLQRFDCGNNNLTDVDVSMLNNLTRFWCNQNSLTSLNIKNGNNPNMTAMWAHNNPSLECIQVDDAALSLGYSNWIKDPTADYMESCTLSNEAFDLSGLKFYPNPINDGFYIESNLEVKLYLYDILGNQIIYRTIGIGVNYLETSSFSAGIYLLKIENENGSSMTKKIIKN